MSDHVPGDLTEQERIELALMFRSGTGRVFLRWLVEAEKEQIAYMRNESDLTEIYRHQGGLRALQRIFDTIDAADEMLQGKEKADG